MEKEIKYKSFNEEHDIYAYIIEPEKNADIKGVLQIAHGMSEYFKRYTEFANFMTNKGFIVCGNDHAGHGKSLNDENLFGYFGNKGYDTLIEDMFTLTKYVQDEYGNKDKYPYFLLGHSMGSFAARAYTSKYYNYLTGAIYSGTNGGNRLLDLGINLSNKGISIKGAKFSDKFVKKISCKTCTRKIKHPKTNSDWISRDESIVDKFIHDEKSNFTFTYNGYNAMLNMLKYVSSDNWYDSIPKNIPIFLFAGSDDPVGDYGKGVKLVYENLILRGVDVTLKIYPGGRHEMLNEINKEEVYNDIYNWLNIKIHYFNSLIK